MTVVIKLTLEQINLQILEQLSKQIRQYIKSEYNWEVIPTERLKKIIKSVSA